GAGEAPVRRASRGAGGGGGPHRQPTGGTADLRQERHRKKGAVGMIHLLAAEGGYQEFTLRNVDKLWLLFSGVTALAAIAVGFSLMRGVLAADEGTPKMIEIATAIQEGAWAYLKRQYKTIAVILVPLAIIVFVTSTKVVKPNGDVALSFGASGLFRTLAFLAGCLMSGLTGYIGMTL